MTRFIFITGGVVSSLGKGLSSAAPGALLQARGFKVRLRKLDPYLNVDPGTMSPYQHGEVYVTDDGAETDLDLGHYERFTGVASRSGDNVTTEDLRVALQRSFSPYERSIDMHVSNLRKKLGVAGRSSDYIKTVRGAGYVCTAND